MCGMYQADMNARRLAGYLGLAMRSGQITLGGEMVLRQIRSGQAALVLIDRSAAVNTQKKLKDACTHHHVPVYLLREGVLTASCGKDRMAGCLKKGGLAQTIRVLLDGQEEGSGTFPEGTDAGEAKEETAGRSSC